MTYLLDTNVISEIRKGPKCDRHVQKWLGSIDHHATYLSVLVLGELRRGVELLRAKDRAAGRALEAWLLEVETNYEDRVFPIDEPIAQEWGRLTSKRPLPTVDALLAATAIVHGLTLVTRDDRDVRGLGVTVVNPFR